MLKLAEPLEGSTCTDADCTLELTPALLAPDEASSGLGVPGLDGAVGFTTVLLEEAVLGVSLEIASSPFWLLAMTGEEVELAVVFELAEAALGEVSLLDEPI